MAVEDELLGLSAEQQRVRVLVEELLAEQEYLGEQRAFNRQPFFRPVTMTAVDGQWQQRPAFTRDISPQGIGLLSRAPVQRREFILTIPRKSGDAVNLRAQMLWCAHCGDGWYVSGGQFLGCVAVPTEEETTPETSSES